METLTGLGEVTRTIADRIRVPAIMVVASGMICRFTISPLDVRPPISANDYYVSLDYDTGLADCFRHP